MATQPANNPNAESPEIDEKLILDANDEAKQRYGRFNLAIVGATGVGKSSIVGVVQKLAELKFSKP